MGFIVNSGEVDKNIEELLSKLPAALEMYGKTSAQKLESYAKENRPWTDRTSRARIGLTGSSELNEDILTIALAHTVDYGVWLELAHEKNYAIVEPTVRLESTGIIEGFQEFFNKLKV